MNTEMAEYIMMILKSRLNILFSWGARRFTAIQDGLMFHVEGFLMTDNWVKVVYNYGSDAFDVYFFTNKKELIKKEEAYIDNLTDLIDFNVEKDGSFDYDQRVREQYSIRIY